MSLTSTTSRNNYAGAGSTGPYPFNFRIFAATDLRVTRRSSVGAETTLAFGADFSLTAGVNIGDPTGSVTLAVALAVGEVLSIRRAPSNLQPVSLANQATYFGKTHEDEFDRLVMQLQALQDQVDRSIGVMESYDPAALTMRVKPETGKALVWQSATAIGNSALDAGAVAVPGSPRTVPTLTAYLLNNAVLNLKDFGAVGDAVTNDAAAIQAWVDACSTDSSNAAAVNVGFAPQGRYRVTSQLRFKKQTVRLMGAGMFETEFYFDGLGAGVSYWVADAIPFFRPFLSDFSINQNASTGKGFDFSAVTNQVYNGALERLYLTAGSDALFAPLFFSMKVDTVWATSTTGHCFRVQCGPGVAWLQCNAVNCGPGKAGYRLAGTINMFGCNGLWSGDYWGVFGQDTTAADGFQNDFPAAGQDYPSVVLVGCNVEEFTTCGIRIHQSYRQVDLIGCKVDRQGLATAYHSMIHTRLQPLGEGQPVRVGAMFFLGAGVPNGGAGLTQAWLHAGTSGVFEDTSGGAITAGITKYYDVGVAGYTPLPRQKLRSDVFQDTAYTFTAVKPRRLSVQMLRYDTPADFTPVGANQALVVTGYTKITVTPAAAASVDKATFAKNPGAGDDYQRNGDLIIEAGNGNLTLNHNINIEGGFRMKSGANVTLAVGEVRCFIWSANYRAGPVAGWVEV